MFPSTTNVRNKISITQSPFRAYPIVVVSGVMLPLIILVSMFIKFITSKMSIIKFIASKNVCHKIYQPLFLNCGFHNQL